VLARDQATNVRRLPSPVPSVHPSAAAAS
jgi:hypothetical protein